MKEIKLKPDKPFYNSVDVAVMDFPKGRGEDPRQRCKVCVDFSEFDVRQLQKRGLDFDGAMEYYKDWLYKIVKLNIASDWTCVEGYEAVMRIIEENVKRFY